MLITWIDKKSVLYHNKRKFKAGDSIPAGVLSQNRIDMLLADKKIRLGEVKTDNKVKESVVFGQAVKSQVIGDVKSPVKKTVQQLKDDAKAKKEAEKEAERLAKEKADDEELQRLIDEEAMK